MVAVPPKNNNNKKTNKKTSWYQSQGRVKETWLKIGMFGEVCSR